MCVGQKTFLDEPVCSGLAEKNMNFLMESTIKPMHDLSSLLVI